MPVSEVDARNLLDAAMSFLHNGNALYTPRYACTHSEVVSAELESTIETREEGRGMGKKENKRHKSRLKVVQRTGCGLLERVSGNSDLDLVIDTSLHGDERARGTAQNVHEIGVKPCRERLKTFSSVAQRLGHERGMRGISGRLLSDLWAISKRLMGDIWATSGLCAHV
eukprot:757605-Pleurochrysis_carterae.AAC.1